MLWADAYPVHSSLHLMTNHLLFCCWILALWISLKVLFTGCRLRSRTCSPPLPLTCAYAPHLPSAIARLVRALFLNFLILRQQTLVQKSFSLIEGWRLYSQWHLPHLNQDHSLDDLLPPLVQSPSVNLIPQMALNRSELWRTPFELVQLGRLLAGSASHKRCLGSTLWATHLRKCDIKWRRFDVSERLVTLPTLRLIAWRGLHGVLNRTD